MGMGALHVIVVLIMLFVGNIKVLMYVLCANSNFESF